ncbi:MAG: hypothetical protein ACLURV_03005 [Gallintestinimicrobium sp.]
MTCWRGTGKIRREMRSAWQRKTFLIKIITPERVFYEGTAMWQNLILRGKIGVYASHPVI